MKHCAFPDPHYPLPCPFAHICTPVGYHSPANQNLSLQASRHFLLPTPLLTLGPHVEPQAAHYSLYSTLATHPINPFSPAPSLFFPPQGVRRNALLPALLFTECANCAHHPLRMGMLTCIPCAVRSNPFSNSAPKPLVQRFP